jgi:predicted RNA binding protein YcfA (HicA-like mRNA interferase family)
MPRKVRQLIADAEAAGMVYQPRRAKGSHRLYEHEASGTQLTISGHTGDDADHYQERQLRQALETIRRWRQEQGE